MIEIKNIHKTFAKQKVLDGVNIFHQGSSTALIGTSGGGKSVILKFYLDLSNPMKEKSS